MSINRGSEGDREEGRKEGRVEDREEGREEDREEDREEGREEGVASWTQVRPAKADEAGDPNASWHEMPLEPQEAAGWRHEAWGMRHAWKTVAFSGCLGNCVTCNLRTRLKSQTGRAHSKSLSTLLEWRLLVALLAAWESCRRHETFLIELQPLVRRSVAGGICHPAAVCFVCCCHFRYFSFFSLLFLCFRFLPLCALIYGVAPKRMRFVLPLEQPPAYTPLPPGPACCQCRKSIIESLSSLSSSSSSAKGSICA